MFPYSGKGTTPKMPTIIVVTRKIIKDRKSGKLNLFINLLRLGCFNIFSNGV